MKSISSVHQLGLDYGGVTGKCFMQLKKVLLLDLSEHVEWVVEPNCHMLTSLKSIDCSNFPSLCVMQFSECTNLCKHRIADCSKLSLPTLTDIAIEKNGIDTLSPKDAMACSLENLMAVLSPVQFRLSVYMIIILPGKCCQSFSAVSSSFQIEDKFFT